MREATREFAEKWAWIIRMAIKREAEGETREPDRTAAAVAPTHKHGRPTRRKGGAFGPFGKA